VLAAGLFSVCGTKVGLYAAQGAGVASSATPPPVAVKFLTLFDQLRAAQDQHAKGLPASHIGFQLSDGEINDYMRYSLQTIPRPGIESVTVKAFPNNYVSTFVVVDFDAVERWKPGTIPAILRPVLRGKKSVWVDYRFKINNAGEMNFTVERARYENIPLPAFLVSKMIAIVAARQPEKYDTSKPLPLPFGLRKLATADHVIQGEN